MARLIAGASADVLNPPSPRAHTRRRARAGDAAGARRTGGARSTRPARQARRRGRCRSAAAAVIVAEPLSSASAGASGGGISGRQRWRSAPCDRAPWRQPKLVGPRPCAVSRWSRLESASFGERRPPGSAAGQGLRRQEVEDDPDVWVPHVSEMRETKARGNLVHTRIHSLQSACKWASYGAGRT